MNRGERGRGMSAAGRGGWLPASLMREIEARPFRTIAETASLLGGTRRWVQTQIALGRLAVCRYGRRMVRIAAPDLVEYIARHRRAVR